MHTPSYKLPFNKEFSETAIIFFSALKFLSFQLLVPARNLCSYVNILQKNIMALALNIVWNMDSNLVNHKQENTVNYPLYRKHGH